MSKLYVKLYGGYTVSGQDFQQQTSGAIRRTVFSPDNVHSVSMVSLRDGTLLFTNEGHISFELTIARGRRVLAVLKYRPTSSYLAINNNWRIQGDIVENSTIHENPDLIASSHVNIDLTDDASIFRVDVKVDTSAFACLVFTEKDLLFVRMNGNHSHPRLIDAINETVGKATSFDSIINLLDSKEQMKQRIWQRLFRGWFFNGFL